MNDWMQTYTGKVFRPLNSEANKIDILDIAHALSMKCRFNGHCKEFYSVAEHSVRVASIISSPNKLWALLHDAPEAYLPDLLGPIKGNFFIGEGGRVESGQPQPDGKWSSDYGVWMRTFTEVEDEIMQLIARKFGLIGDKIPDDVKIADRILLMTEARDLMGTPPQSWGFVLRFSLKRSNHYLPLMLRSCSFLLLMRY